MEQDLFIVIASNADLLADDFDGCLCRSGWATLLDHVLHDWRRAGAPKIRRLREKMGTLRITAIEQAHPEARRLRQVAMERSGRICEVCGEPGKSIAKSGVRATRCSRHQL